MRALEMKDQCGSVSLLPPRWLLVEMAHLNEKFPGSYG